MVAVGAVLRIRLYLANRSLWSDEARLALNLVDRSFAGLWQPLDWRQGAPVGFLMLQKSVICLLGSSEYALRLIPLLCGIASLVWFYFLAKKILDPGAVLVGLAMMSLSKGLIDYSAEVKQYSMDVLVALVILAATVRCFQVDAPGDKRRGLVVWGVLSAILLWFSNPVVFVIAGTGIVLMVSNRRDARLIAAGGAAFAGASFAVDYFLVLRPLHQSAYLYEFWQQGGFMPRPINFRAIRWVWKAYLLAFRTPGGFKLPVFTPLVFLIGVVKLSARNRWLAAVLLLPTLAALAAGALGEYPYLHRLILFVLPMLFLVSAVGLQTLWEIVQGPQWLAIVVVSAAFFGGAVVADVKAVISPERTEEIKPVLSYLQGHRKEGEMIDVFWAAEPAVRYYAGRFGLGAGEFRVIADTDAAGFAGEVQRSSAGGVWIVLTHRSDEERHTIVDLLDHVGKRVYGISAPGADVECYDFVSK